VAIQPSDVDQRVKESPAPADLTFSGLLFPASEPGPAGAAGQADRAFVQDLCLDQVIAAVAGDREERDLIVTLLSTAVTDVGTLRYRQDVFGDLEDPRLLAAVTGFGEQLRRVRAHLRQLADMESGHQREGWFLDAAAIYCDAVKALATDLSAASIASAGLTAFGDYLAGYAASAGFTELAAQTARCQGMLGEIRYLVRIKGPKVEVSRYDGEPDYSEEIAATFERFRQGAVKDYLIGYHSSPGMNHVGAQILELVARLFSDEFAVLRDYCRQQAGFLDPVIRQFDRDLQFYLAYLSYIKPLRAAGLSFCLPELLTVTKEILATDTFDLALAARLVRSGQPVVTNDFDLAGAERVIVVSGPNQGGKTTFARTFGQLHHLARVGCPVPGVAARLFLPDQLLTHFEREEDIEDLTGKLEDDLLRIRQALLAATPDSIVIMNEIFTSTTLSDARLLGEKVLRKVTELDLLCVYVTFVDELASFGPTVVSMASTVDSRDPARRTYKVVRRPADGLAYALAIAAKHRVTYEQLKERLTS
jgi:DNA mismatch repair protein MutS